MRTLMIQYQIGHLPPSWYPLYSAMELSDEEVGELLAQQRNGSGAFRNILQHVITPDDGLTDDDWVARDRASERAERDRCDPGYQYDVRFGTNE